MLVRLWKLAALLTGLLLGLALPWALYLDYQVTREFEGRKWDLPSRVYARPLSLYLGREINAAALAEELAAAGYRAVESPTQPGSYRRSGGSFEIHRRSFRFDDGAEDPLRLHVSLGPSGVDALRDVTTGAPLDLVRLDPAEIASIFPLHEEDRTVIAIA